MSQFIACRCGNDVAFEEEDRGAEVYCPSCGQACQVPDSSPEREGHEPINDTETPADNGPHSTPQSELPPSGQVHVVDKPVVNSIFSANSSEIVVDHVACLCGHQIGVHADDFGHTVYCPKCGSEVQVGATLDRSSVGRQANVVEDDDDDVLAPPTEGRMRWRQLPATLAIVGLVVVAGLAAGYLTWDDSRTLLDFADSIQSVATTIETDAAPGEFDPTKVTVKSIERLASPDNPFDALLLLGGWRNGLRQHEIDETDERFAKIEEVIDGILKQHHDVMLELIDKLSSPADAAVAFQQARDWLHGMRACGVENEDLRVAKLQIVARRLVEIVDPITLEMIANLLTEDDAGDALIQAQLWQAEVQNRTAAEDDERLAKLAEVIETLFVRLTPAAEDHSALIAEFRSAVDRLTQQLRERDVNGAKKTSDEIDKLLAAHPDQLAPLAKRYLTLKAHLERLRLQRQGVEGLRGLLKSALTAAESGQDSDVENALLNEAKAKFYAARTPMTTEEEAELKRLAEDLAPKLQFAQGKRAVNDAQRANAAGEKSVRNGEVLRALKLLPGLPGNQVKPYLTLVEPWREEAMASGVMAGAASSPLAKELVRRNLFEDALEPYGRSDCNALMTACLSYRSTLTPAEYATDERYNTLQKLFFDAADAELAQWIGDEPDSSPSEVKQRLQTIVFALNRATEWTSSARWKVLDGAIRQQGDRFAKDSLEDALVLAKQERFSDAIRAIELAITLGNTETSAQARHWKSKWQSEVKIRADRKAEADAIARIKRLWASKKVAECWQELEVFVQRYPGSAHLEKAKQFKQDIEKHFQEQFEAMSSQIDEYMQAGNMVAALAQLAAMEATVFDERQRATLAGLRQKVTTQAERIRIDFQLLGIRKRLINESDILEVRRAATLLLALEPDNVEAQQLFNEAEAKGRARAKRTLEQTERSVSLRPKQYQDQLISVVRLDPDGPYGKRARQLLKEL